MRAFCPVWEICFVGVTGGEEAAAHPNSSSLTPSAFAIAAQVSSRTDSSPASARNTVALLTPANSASLLTE
jgi:hypothetical protein